MPRWARICWGLPFPIVEAVAYHHAPGAVSSGAFDILAAVHVADALALERTADTAGGGRTDLLDMAFLEKIGVAGKLAEWRALADHEAAHLAAKR